MKAKLTTILVTMCVTTGLLALAWYGMLHVPPNAARAWALTATLLLFPVGALFWFLGHTEARGRLAGIDLAVDKVMGTATRAAGLGVQTRQAMHQATREQHHVVVLPDTQITQRRLTEGSTVVEL